MGNRLSLGTWNLPFAPGRNEGYKGRRQSYRFPASRAAKGPDYGGGIASTTGLAQSDSSMSNMIQLAGIITRDMEKLTWYIKETGTPVPSI